MVIFFKLDINYKYIVIKIMIFLKYLIVYFMLIKKLINFFVFVFQVIGLLMLRRYNIQIKELKEQEYLVIVVVVGVFGVIK